MSLYDYSEEIPDDTAYSAAEYTESMMSAFNGAKLLPNFSDQVDMKTEETTAGSVVATIIAIAPPGSALADEVWAIRKVIEDSSSSPVTTNVRWAKKTIDGVLTPTAKFVHAADDFSTLVFDI